MTDFCLVFDKYNLFDRDTNTLTSSCGSLQLPPHQVLTIPYMGQSLELHIFPVGTFMDDWTNGRIFGWGVVVEPTRFEFPFGDPFEAQAKEIVCLLETTRARVSASGNVHTDGEMRVVLFSERLEMSALHKPNGEVDGLLFTPEGTTLFIETEWLRNGPVFEQEILLKLVNAKPE